MATSRFSQKIRDYTWSIRDSFSDKENRQQIAKAVGVIVGVLIILMAILMIWWSITPSQFDPVQDAKDTAAEKQQQVIVGYTSTNTVIHMANTLLTKSGGYLTNDVMPPSVWMDNMPRWEFGVLVQIRDYARALRNDISRSQSQSAEDKDLVIAEPQFNFNSQSWMFPSSEREYRRGLKALESYQARLGDGQNEAKFYARADNLAAWLENVEKRLGSLSQRLSASVGEIRVNTDLAGDANPSQPTPANAEYRTKTPWLEVDNVFYEARGATWALIHLLKATEHDFHDILQKKNALVSLRQIIRELEGTQKILWSPIVLNGSGFGLFANHSLVMASYISRANAALIDLRALLSQG